MCYSRPLFSLFSSLQYSWQWTNALYKFLLMSGFKWQASGVVSDNSTNWATTTAQHDTNMFKLFLRCLKLQPNIVPIGAVIRLSLSILSFGIWLARAYWMRWNFALPFKHLFLYLKQAYFHQDLCLPTTLTSYLIPDAPVLIICYVTRGCLFYSEMV